jgi:anthranilate phosphoribosyltransferase
VTVRPVDATRLGLAKASSAKLAGGTPEDNAAIVVSILRGEPGARRDVVLLNAGAALVVAGVVDDLAAGVERAALTIDAGLGTELLGRLRDERRAAEAARPAVAEGAPA